MTGKCAITTASCAFAAALAAALGACNYLPTSPTEAPDKPPLTLKGEWFVRYGDSPPEPPASPQWALEPAAPPSWERARSLSLPTENGHSNIWLATVLPEWPGRDPSLFMHSVDLLFEAYIDGALIYSFGRMDVGGQGSFAGWPWHVIPLPRDFAGKTVYFRIFSYAHEIGIVGNVILGSPADHYLRIVRNDLGRVAFAGLLLFVAFAIIVLSLRLEERLVLYAFAGFTVQAAIWLFAETEMKQLLFNSPMFWIYTQLACLYLAPATISIFIARTYARDYGFIMFWLILISVLYAAASLALSLAGMLPLPLTIMPFNVFEFCAMGVVLLVTLRAAWKGNQEARIFSLGLMMLTPFVVFDVLNTWTGWSPPVSHWGLMLFVTTMLFILRKRVARLKTQSTHDSLTGIANRYRFDEAFESEWRRGQRSLKPLAIIMADIDHFKSYNDTYGHQKGDFVLKAIAEVLAIKIRREPDLCARYGGEEFVLLLPETGEQDAAIVAERLRAAVDALGIPHAGSPTADRVTISLGTASMVPIKNINPAVIVERADRALYCAKASGRNMVCSTADADRHAKAGQRASEPPPPASSVGSAV
jgi:diguanylate cyclase (GGDEF)-like protein